MTKHRDQKEEARLLDGGSVYEHKFWLYLGKCFHFLVSVCRVEAYLPSPKALRTFISKSNLSFLTQLQGGLLWQANALWRAFRLCSEGV